MTSVERAQLPQTMVPVAHLPKQKSIELRKPSPDKKSGSTGWRSKVNSPRVEAAFEQFTRHLVTEWVTDLWCSRITPDKDGPEELISIVNSVLGEISKWARSINIITLLTRLESFFYLMKCMNSCILIFSERWVSYEDFIYLMQGPGWSRELCSDNAELAKEATDVFIWCLTQSPGIHHLFSPITYFVQAWKPCIMKYIIYEEIKFMLKSRLPYLCDWDHQDKA